MKPKTTPAYVVFCPYCKVAPFQWCVTKGGKKLSKYHTVRSKKISVWIKQAQSQATIRDKIRTMVRNGSQIKTI